MKRQKTIKMEFVKATVALLGYSVAPVFLAFILLFVDMNRVLRAALGLGFFVIAVLFLFSGGMRFGKYAYKYIGVINRKEDSYRHANFMAWKPQKGFLLCIPYMCVISVFLLLSMITNVVGGIFRILSYIMFTPTAFLAIATAGINDDLQITWAGFVIFLVTAISYVTVFSLGYIIMGLRLRRSEAEMVREIKSFDF